MGPCPGFLHGWWLWSMLHPPWVKCPSPRGADVRATLWLEASRSDGRLSTWKNVPKTDWNVLKASKLKKAVKHCDQVWNHKLKKNNNNKKIVLIINNKFTSIFTESAVGLKQRMHCSSYLTNNMKNNKGSQERKSRQRAERKGRM